MLLVPLIPSFKSKCTYHSLSTKVHFKIEEGRRCSVAEGHRQMKFLIKGLAPSLVAVIVALSPIVNPPESVAQAIDIQRGASLFGRACIGCHDAGGNIIQPGFGEKCKPRGQCTFGPRLREEEIRLLAEFVKAQAEQGWPSIGTYEE